METKPLLKPDYWYDRSIRSWTLLWIDQNGNQEGTAEHFAGKDAKKRMLEYIKAEQPNKIDLSPKIDPSVPVVIVFTMHKPY